MSDPAHRYSGGQAGSEDRYHYPAADDARHGTVSQGRFDTSGLHRGGTGFVEAAQANTMAGGRGKIMGASLPDDRGGFC